VALTFAEATASRREPGPLSAVVVTTKVAARAPSGASVSNAARAMQTFLSVRLIGIRAELSVNHPVNRRKYAKLKI
jgi:hypothetical protein